MMTALNMPIPDKCVTRYLDSLVGKIYKILPMKENNTAFLQQYVEWKIREMLAFRDFVRAVGDDPDFVRGNAVEIFWNAMSTKLKNLIVIMYALANQEQPVESVRHDVFEAIRICKRLKKHCGTAEVDKHE